jgi:hypothetical protein
VEQKREDPDMNPRSHAHLTFDKVAKNIQGEKIAFQHMLLEKLNICMQKTESHSMSLTLHKYQLKVDLRP